METQHVAGGVDDPDVGLMGDKPADLGDLAIAMGENGEGGISQDAHGPLEDGPAIHGEVVKALFEGQRRRGNAAAARRPAEEVASRAVRAKLVGDQPLIFFSGASMTAPAPSPKSGKLFWSPGLITRLLQSPPITRAHWLLPVATNWAAITSAKTKPAHAACTSKAGQLSLSRSWIRLAVAGNAMSGVKVATTNRSTSAGSRPADFRQRMRGLGAQVARGLVRKCESPLVNSRAVDDPLRIESVRLQQVLIGNDQLGDIAARTENPYAQERTRLRREVGLAVAHEQYVTDFIRDVSVTSLLRPLARNTHLLQRNWPWLNPQFRQAILTRPIVSGNS